MAREPLPLSASGFSMSTEIRDGETLVVCAGRLTSEHSDKLKKHARELVPHAKRLVMDFKEVARMDSSGLGALVGIYVSAKKANCEFLLINYNGSIKDLLGVTNVLSMFEDCARSGMRMP
ncbi:MAG TPA: STAS domain-containing protein [Candidatus Acidoferrales bacterium]|nr:STAS domain-containing protein [Candidatus Acidoferrales bacterium]